MQKRPIITFVIGVMIGGLVVGCFWFGSNVAEGFRSWGKAEVYFDEEAVARISDPKLKPSPTAKDVYYFVKGFQDYVVFIAYTDTADAIDRTVVSLAGKHPTDLHPWMHQIESGSLREPGSHDKHHLTSLFDIDSVKRGRFFSSPPGKLNWHIILDEETNRLYYCEWDI